MNEKEDDTDRTDGVGDRTPIVRRIVIPRELRDADMRAIWGSDGPGILLARLATEDMLGDKTADPLTPEELSRLLVLFQDEPLPPSLRNVLIRELHGERRSRPGPKARKSPQDIVELAMLPFLYKDALAEAREERKRLVEEERNKPRRARAERMPAVSELAATLIRKWLPTLRHLSDKAIANKVSELKDIVGKRPRRRKSRKPSGE